MKVVVTGAAGFIGSNIIARLNMEGIDDIIAVDDLSNGAKFSNIVNAGISDYFDKEVFYNLFEDGYFGAVEAVFHEGACSDTMVHDGKFMLETNYRSSKTLLDACSAQNIRLIYASSAAVYGGSSSFTEKPENERPLNVYGYSKLLFDNVVRRSLRPEATQVVGFRYFNVYGPREGHKGRMSSVALQHYHQLAETRRVKLFSGDGSIEAGQQLRDFVHIDDVVDVNMWFFKHPTASGIFNVGTGRAESFNAVAQAGINHLRAAAGEQPVSVHEAVDRGLVEYIAFPEALRGHYQNYTQADIGALRAAGYDRPFRTVASGITDYFSWLDRQNDAFALEPSNY